MCLSNRLRDFMEKQRLSSPALARMAGVPESTIKNILQGKSKNPEYRTLGPIAKALGVSLHQLTGESIEGEGAPTHEEIALFKECIDVVSDLEQAKNYTLSFEQKKFIARELFHYAQEKNKETKVLQKPDLLLADWLFSKIEHS